MDPFMPFNGYHKPGQTTDPRFRFQALLLWLWQILDERFGSIGKEENKVIMIDFDWNMKHQCKSILISIFR